MECQANNDIQENHVGSGSQDIQPQDELIHDLNNEDPNLQSTLPKYATPLPPLRSEWSPWTPHMKHVVHSASSQAVLQYQAWWG